jgi:hypothetical protein
MSTNPHSRETPKLPGYAWTDHGFYLGMRYRFISEKFPKVSEPADPKIRTLDSSKSHQSQSSQLSKFFVAMF